MGPGPIVTRLLVMGPLIANSSVVVMWAGLDMSCWAGVDCDWWWGRGELVVGAGPLVMPGGRHPRVTGDGACSWA